MASPNWLSKPPPIKAPIPIIIELIGDIQWPKEHPWVIDLANMLFSAPIAQELQNQFPFTFEGLSIYLCGSQ